MAEWVRASTGDRTFDGSSPTSVKTFRFGTLAIPLTLLCQCLSDETLNCRWSLLSGEWWARPRGSQLRLGGHLTLTSIIQQPHTNTPTAGRRGATLSA